MPGHQAEVSDLHLELLIGLTDDTETTLLLLEMLNDPRLDRWHPHLKRRYDEREILPVLADLESRGLVGRHVQEVRPTRPGDPDGNIPELAKHRSSLQWWYLTSAGRELAMATIRDAEAP